MFARPIVRQFAWADGHDGDSGLAGWQMKGFEKLEPVQGFGIAHDALEHFDATLGMDAEMMAFGAILWARWNHGWQQNGLRPSYDSALASDIQGFMYEGSEWCTPRPLRLLRESEVEGAEWAESQIVKLHSAVVTSLCDEASWFEDLSYAKGRSLTRDAISARVNDMMQWVRKGLKRTDARWSRAGGQSAFMDCFDQIANHDYCKSGFEIGDRLTLHIHGGCRGVDFKLKGPSYEDY